MVTIEEITDAKSINKTNLEINGEFCLSPIKPMDKVHSDNQYFEWITSSLSKTQRGELKEMCLQNKTWLNSELERIRQAIEDSNEMNKETPMEVINDQLKIKIELNDYERKLRLLCSLD